MTSQDAFFSILLLSGGALARGPATSLRVICGSQPILAESTGGQYLPFKIHNPISYQAQASVQSDITVVKWLCPPPNTEVSQPGLLMKWNTRGQMTNPALES